MHEISDVSKQINGCGKLAYSLVLKLCKKSLPGPNGTVCPGASKFEILTLIYLSQIADASGYVSQYTTKELAGVIGCDPRSVYPIIDGLRRKGFITAKYYEDMNWSGVKDIKILNNDFSKIGKYDKTTRYISTFYPFFNFSDEQALAFMSGLSLYALRTLLYLLTVYSHEHGLKLSCNTVCDTLQIHDRALVVGYLEELSAYLGKDFYIVKKAANKRYIYGNVIIAAKNVFFVPDRPSDSQLTYYKRRWALYFINNDISIAPGESLPELLNLLFTSVYSWMTKGFALEFIESVYQGKLETDKIVSKFSIYRGGGAMMTFPLPAIN